MATRESLGSMLMKTIFLEMESNCSDIRQGEKDRNFYQMAITPQLDADFKKGSELESAYCDALNEATEQGFAMGFKAAMSLVFCGT